MKAQRERAEMAESKTSIASSDTEDFSPAVPHMDRMRVPGLHPIHLINQPSCGNKTSFVLPSRLAQRLPRIASFLLKGQYRL